MTLPFFWNSSHSDTITSAQHSDTASLLFRLQRRKTLHSCVRGKVSAGPVVTVDHDTDEEGQGVETENIDFVGREVASETALSGLKAESTDSVPHPWDSSIVRKILRMMNQIQVNPSAQ
jgi:osmotically-inducible protein OsmY